MDLWAIHQTGITPAANGRLLPPGKPRNEWSNAHSFTDGGYLARILRQTCTSCHAVADHVQGIFHVEFAPNGSRRLQALGRGAQWPLADGHRVEVERQDVPYCAHCLSLLGFTAPSTVPDARTILILQPTEPA